MSKDEPKPPRKRKPRGATGLFVTEHEVVATTLGGTATPDAVSVPIVDGDVGAALDTLREDELLGAKIAVGIDPRWLYVLTTSGAVPRDGPSASDALSRHLGDADGLCAGRSTLRIGSAVHTRTVGCPRPLAEAIYDAVHPEQDGPRLRLAPTPDLVLRTALGKKRTPRRWVHHLRILPGDPDGLVLLVHRGQVVAWRLFEFKLGSDPWGIETAILGLLGHAAEDIGITDVRGGLLHVGADAAGSSAHAELAKHLGEALRCPIEVAPEVLHDAALCSATLARAAKSGWRGTDLFEDMHPDKGLAASFPYFSAAGLLIAAGGSFHFLDAEATRLEEAVARIDVEVAQAADEADIALAELVDEHERMVHEARTAYAFLVNRVPWSQALRILPEMLSENTRLEVVEGHDEVEYPAGEDGAVRRNGRSMLINCEVPMRLGEQTSPEAGNIANAVRLREPYASLLSRVDKSDIQTLPSSGGQRLAKISLKILPEGE